MEINTLTIVSLIAGFIAGVLVTRNNFTKVNKVVSDIDSKIDTVKKSRRTGPKKRPGRPRKKTTS